MPAMTFKATSELINSLLVPLVTRIKELEVKVQSLTKPEIKSDRSKKKSNK